MIKNGHDAERLQHYTERQLKLYYDELVKLQNQERANRIEDISVGFNGGKNTSKFIKQLRGEQ